MTSALKDILDILSKESQGESNYQQIQLDLKVTSLLILESNFMFCYILL